MRWQSGRKLPKAVYAMLRRKSQDSSSGSEKSRQTMITRLFKVDRNEHQEKSSIPQDVFDTGAWPRASRRGTDPESQLGRYRAQFDSESVFHATRKLDQWCE